MFFAVSLYPIVFIKMKIGILTLPLHTNYGGILQAYALQTVLERMGHEVCLIEKKRKVIPSPLWKVPLVYGKRILKNLTGQPYPIFYELKYIREEPILGQNTNLFINKYIKRKIVKDFKCIKESDFDAFVVGSDQIWRPKYFPKIEDAYLAFTKSWNIKRISYAASFGTDKWEYTSRKTKLCGGLLHQFNAVSVREIQGIDLCQKYFKVKAVHVLDPTMLLSAKDYILLFEKANIPKGNGTLFSYILDETPKKKELIEQIAKEKNLVPFRVNSEVDDRALPISERVQPPVESWLRGFYDAELVVTDSFHACVFSILFQKPFIVINNNNRGGTRFSSLLGIFGLNDCLVKDDLDISIINMNINWENITISLNDYILQSKSFLVEALQK